MDNYTRSAALPVGECVECGALWWRTYGTDEAFDCEHWPQCMADVPDSLLCMPRTRWYPSAHSRAATGQ